MRHVPASHDTLSQWEMGDHPGPDITELVVDVHNKLSLWNDKVIQLLVRELQKRAAQSKSKPYPKISDTEAGEIVKDKLSRLIKIYREAQPKVVDEATGLRETMKEVEERVNGHHNALLKKRRRTARRHYVSDGS